MEEGRDRQAHRVHWLWLVLMGLVLLVGVPVGAYCWLYRQVRPLTVWEMTGSCPPASALLKDGGEGRWCFDTDRIDWSRPGEAVVLVAGKDGPRIAKIRLVDTTAPTARGVAQVLGMDEELSADKFIADLTDAQLVGVSFEEAPPFHQVGEWPVTIRLEDLSGNVSFVTTTCTILGPVSRLAIEAGEAVPPLGAFLPKDTPSGRFVTDVDALDTTVPGVYMIEVEAAGQVFETALTITDTVLPVCAFSAEIPYTPTGRALAADSLVTASDVTALTVAFDPEPDWTQQGYQVLTIAVTDAGGNRVTGQVTVLVSDLAPLTWEASRRFVTGYAILDRQQELDASFSGEVKVARFVPKQLGCFDVNAMVDDVPCIQRLYVVDTTAPRLSFPKKPQAYQDHPVAPEALLQVAEDATDMSLSYTVEPDWTELGPQPVAIAAVDAAGNRAEIQGTVTIVRDTEAPKITGVMNQYVYIGEAVAYFAQASATDNADEEVTLTVDNSAVDMYTVGVYPVTYRATDRAGNTAQKTAYLYIVQPSVSDEKLQEAADKVLSKIVTEDMTKGQKAYAIYRYVYDNFTFRDHTSNKRDWKYEAWRGLTTRRGDCFTFCAAARELLEQIGAKVMFVIRDSGNRHYWLMVDLGTGWYHFDPLNSGPSKKFECFMLTTQEVLDLYPFFWKYNHKIYPETATEKFVRDW